MVEIKHKISVSTVLTHLIFKNLAKTTGVSLVDICKIAQINPLIFKDRDARIPVSTKMLETTWERVENVIKDRNFGLILGKEIAHNYMGGNILLNVMLNCSTVGEAIEKFCQYHDIMADVIQPKLKIHDDFAYLYFKWGISKPDIKISKHISEALLYAGSLMLRTITDNKSIITEIRFEQPRPENISEYKRIFNTSIVFEQNRDEFVIERKHFDLPIDFANLEFLETLEQFAQKLLDRLYSQKTWSNKVIQLISTLLIRGKKVDIETISKNLTISTRNLQNRLKEEGTTYQKILDEVRKEIALDYLKKDEASIVDISFLLGFSEQSSFNHAFKRWTGSTPKEYRKK